jgi:hypothetical protein
MSAESAFRLLVCVTLSVAGWSAPAQNHPAPTAATVAKLAWLEGDWVSTAGDVKTEERWTSAAGGAMLGLSRTIKGERMVAFEFLRIVEREGGLSYIAQPNGNPPTTFPLARMDSESVTFENRQHDYPKVIRYAKRPDGMLEAEISGADGSRKQTWVLRRQP